MAGEAAATPAVATDAAPGKTKSPQQKTAIVAPKDAAPPPGAPPEAPSYKGTKHRVVIDGKPLDIDYDDLVRGYGHSQAANRRMQEAAEARKAAKGAEEFLQSVKGGDWRRLIETVGYKAAREFAENLLTQEMEFERMTPEQKRAHELEHENKRLKETEAERIKREKLAASERVKAKALDDLDQEIKSFLDTLGRKPTPRIVERIISEMHYAQAYQGKAITPKEAWDRAEKYYGEGLGDFIAGMTPEQIAERLPKHTLETLRKKEVEAVLSKDAFHMARIAAGDDATKGNLPLRGGRRMSTDDFFAKKEKKFGGR
jgi:hypothetical protein